jgi:hypothetical protein
MGGTSNLKGRERWGVAIMYRTVRDFSDWSESGRYFPQLWSSGSQTVIQVGLK